MNKIIHVLLVCLSVVGCSRNSSPVQVISPIEFGGYQISPPYGYWYFPRKISSDFRKSDFLVLLTFWPNKKDVTYRNRQYAPGEQVIFLNFVIAENKYGSFEAYYAAAKKAGVTYLDLSPEQKILQMIPDWSCKQSNEGIYGIECISLRDDLLTIGVHGDDKNQVLMKIPLLKRMIESLIALKT